MSHIAAATKPIPLPKTPTDRHPIFTPFGGSPPFTPRVSSQVTVSGDRCNSSAISFSERPFSLYSMALFAIEFTSFIRSPTPLRTMRDAGYQDMRLWVVRSETGEGTYRTRPCAVGEVPGAYVGY